jgi:MFS family permease
MEQQAREQAFMNALATEHFVLQAARSAIVGDQVGRATIYIGAVSGALIAFGFLAQVVSRLDPFVIAVLPALFVLGEFTFAAMWHNTVENLVLLRKMQDIRGYYRGLVPEAGRFFDPPEADALYQAALGTVGLRVAPLQMLFTGASVVAAINSILGGAGVGLLAVRLGRLGDTVAVAVGLVVALILFGLHLLYQQRQGTQVGLRP